MKAAIINSVNSPLTIEELELPELLDIGQVQVRITVSGLCGAQLQEIKGEKGNSKFMPHLTGHEGCGFVEKIGPGVTRVKVGDKVILHWRKSSGIESNFPSYLKGGGRITGGKVNTLAEKVIVSENRLTAVPEDTDDDFCALMGCGLSTSFSVVSNECNLKFGESVLVIGCGGVGLGCISSANLLHASRVYGLDLDIEKKNLVEKNGGTFFLSQDFLELAKLNKLKIDCIVDTVGDLDLLSEFIGFLSDAGRCILVSLPKNGTSLTIQDPNGFFGANGKVIKTTQAGGFDPDRDIKRFLDLYKKEKINFRNIVTHRYKLSEINQALETLRSGKSGRILIDIK
jgi:Zn-dependent alcohol dehydrogenase